MPKLLSTQPSRNCLIAQTPSSAKLHTFSRPTKWINLVPVVVINDLSIRRKPIRNANVDTSRTINPILQESQCYNKRASPTNVEQRPLIISPSITSCSKKHSKLNNVSSIELQCQYIGKISLTDKSRNSIYIGNSGIMKDSSLLQQSESRKTKTYRDFKSCIFGLANTCNSRPPLAMNYMRMKKSVVEARNMNTSMEVRLHALNDSSSPRNESLCDGINTSNVSRKKVSQAFRLSLQSHF